MPRDEYGAGVETMGVGIEAAGAVVRQQLGRLAKTLAHDGIPRPALDGKLLRPLTAYLTVPEVLRPALDDRFWWGALAVEMVHEASLLHDDILDDAPERRGKPTLSVTAGIGPALVLGDHLLTSAYRAALNTGSQEFLSVFIKAVERTVAGEIAQEMAQGQGLPEETYRRNITGKSGELFRAVFSLLPNILGVGSTREVGEIGAHLGCLYQMVDDFLDYCPDADRGKPPLQDFRQRKWTWPLDLAGISDFEMSEADILHELFVRPDENTPAPMENGVLRVADEVQTLLRELTGQGLEAGPLSSLLSGWIQLLRRAALEEVDRFSAGGPSFPEPHLFDSEQRPPTLLHGSQERLAAACESLGDPEARLAYFGEHARTFRFASRLFPKGALDLVAGVYAFCRFTDDLVDEAEGVDPAALESLLDTWEHLAREAYESRPTGIPLLDQVLGTARDRNVPFHYVEELVAGVRMDIRPVDYQTLKQLRTYSYRVASVVGGWLTELFGIHDPRVLERAYALGHAMQLTNILRDVGEDLESGRLYLPKECLDRYGVDRSLLEAKARAGSLMFPGYRRVLEDLMERAEADYEAAFQAIPALPGFFQGPVAVAAGAYRGIHSEIRRNGYDNLTRRASTSFFKKVRLGIRALWDLALLKRSKTGPQSVKTGGHSAVDEAQEAAV